MKAAVTGGAGFIGSHVVDALLKGGFEVVVLDKGVEPHRTDVGFVDLDILDYGAVLEATEGCDYIFHLAAVSNVNHAFQDPVHCVRANILGTTYVLEAARHHKVKRVLFASTVWVYSGAEGNNVHENSPFFMAGAGHIYTSSKIAGEMIFQDYQKLYGQSFTILRYGIPYGPRMRDQLVIPIFLRKALSGEPITISGDGSQYRNFIYVEDMAQAHVLALRDVAENQVYNLEGKKRVSIRDIAETIDRLLGGGVKIEYLPARPGDYGGKEVSAEKAKAELGWEATIDFEEGMRRTLEWYRSRLNGR